MSSRISIKYLPEVTFKAANGEALFSPKFERTGVTSRESLSGAVNRALNCMVRVKDFQVVGHAFITKLIAAGHDPYVDAVVEALIQGDDDNTLTTKYMVAMDKVAILSGIPKETGSVATELKVAASQLNSVNDLISAMKQNSSAGMSSTHVVDVYTNVLNLSACCNGSTHSYLPDLATNSKGQKMIVTAMVSRPRLNQRDRDLLDAALNLIGLNSPDHIALYNEMQQMAGSGAAVVANNSKNICYPFYISLVAAMMFRDNKTDTDVQSFLIPFVKMAKTKRGAATKSHNILQAYNFPGYIQGGKDIHLNPCYLTPYRMCRALMAAAPMPLVTNARGIMMTPESIAFVLRLYEIDVELGGDRNINDATSIFHHMLVGGIGSYATTHNKTGNALNVTVKLSGQNYTPAPPMTQVMTVVAQPQPQRAAAPMAPTAPPTAAVAPPPAPAPATDRLGNIVPTAPAPVPGTVPAPPAIAPLPGAIATSATTTVTVPQQQQPQQQQAPAQAPATTAAATPTVAVPGATAGISTNTATPSNAGNNSNA
ncbi:hypothetical protein [Beihai shrimp virus 3]|uniref:hypothetical protein n=1 Tax=Beihai shrimp virus 3 TaxID=1922669 RepID=UPI00090C4FFC|nr:hypothetical protein [Beihai shrimp virus 3]APG79222.1 hypothetical protein [Beihai shrimp virus 3]APG79241.1 hypothetical protein [Beihai shrimp virus 3]